MPWVYSDMGPVSITEIVGFGVFVIGGIAIAAVTALLVIRIIKFAITGSSKF